MPPRRELKSDGAGERQPPEAVRCEQFLARHAEFLDKAMSGDDAAAWRDHASRCGSCSRYDDAVRRSLSLLELLPVAETSPDFATRLQHRLFYEEDVRSAGRSFGTGVRLSLSVAAVLAAVAASPLLVRYSPPSHGVAPARATAKALSSATVAPLPTTPASDLYAGLSTGSAGAWETERGAAEESLSALAAQDAPFARLAVWPEAHISHMAAPIRNVHLTAPGPYTPLIIGPPVYSRVPAVPASLSQLGFE